MPTKIKYPCAHLLPLSWSTCVLCSLPSLQGLVHTPLRFPIHCSLGRISNINIGMSTTQLLFNYSAPTRVVLFSTYIHYSDGITQFKFQRCEHSEKLLNNINNTKAVLGIESKVLPIFGDGQTARKLKWKTKKYTQTFTPILVCSFFWREGTGLIDLIRFSKHVQPPSLPQKERQQNAYPPYRIT